MDIFECVHLQQAVLGSAPQCGHRTRRCAESGPRPRHCAPPAARVDKAQDLQAEQYQITDKVFIGYRLRQTVRASISAAVDQERSADAPPPQCSTRSPSCTMGSRLLALLHKGAHLALEVRHLRCQLSRLPARHGLGLQRALLPAVCRTCIGSASLMSLSCVSAQRGRCVCQHSR